MQVKTEEHKKKIAVTMEKKWQDKEWREKMIEKQIKAGLRER